ncbi:restriction endonuclease subunit S [Novosphingobium huizhouense]|uniref:restriction endonuclease subunit S n=1 Tax=Novosphingobium huizhouense TaxID=2866625 RepID=UPI001CD82A45|nr:restriction endonuclease subunit S [Novosphingobium huizhouense]
MTAIARELPKGWIAVTLEDVCLKITDGSHNPPAKQPHGRAMLSAVNIFNNQISFDQVRLITPDDFEREDRRTEVSPGDVLLTIVGSIGRVATVPATVERFTLQRSVAVLKPHHIHSRFLMYQIESSRPQGYLRDNAKGTAQKGVYLRTLAAMPVDLPPLAEQERIVEKIETLFAEIDKGEEALRAVRKLLARYRQSVLKAAVTGALTADWRAANGQPAETGQDLLTRILKHRRVTWQGRGRYVEPVEPDTRDLPELPDGWVWASLAQLTHIKGGVTVDKKHEPNDPVTLPYLRVANVQNGYLDLTEIKDITVERDRAEQCRLKPGDILMNEGGDRDKLGRGWVWSGELDPCIHQNHVFRARPVLTELNSRFISYYANAFGQPFFMTKGKQSVNLASISLTAISGLPIPLPPIDEQNELVARIEEVIDQIVHGTEACSMELARSAALRQSILRQAFAGKLVPQDPADEPAADLLARIRASQAAAPKRARTKVLA